MAILLIGLSLLLMRPGFERDAPVLLGAENGASGQTLRRLVFEGSHLILIKDLPDPGGGHRVSINFSHFYLEVPGQTRRELKFLPSAIPDNFIMQGICKPVAGTSLWVTAGYYMPGSNLTVMVFDAEKLICAREFSIKSDLINHGPDFNFDPGNQRLNFITSSGRMAYDVRSNQLVPRH